MAANGIDQRAQQRAGGVYPARQQRPIEVDTFPGVKDGLAVQRQMIGELCHQYMPRLQRQSHQCALELNLWAQMLCQNSITSGGSQIVPTALGRRLLSTASSK